MRRRPLACRVFPDTESVTRYHRQAAQWMRTVARGFVTTAETWGIGESIVLDVGTATGSLAIEFARGMPRVRVVGLDLSDAALALARANAREHGVSSRVTFKKGNAEDVPFEDGSFDVVISCNTLHLIEHPVRLFDEIRRVLKPQGRFIVADFRRSWLGLFIEHFRAAYATGEVVELLSRSRLEGWDVRDSFFWIRVLSVE